MKRIVDLSQEIYEGMPVYAGHLETKVWQHHRFEDTAPNFDSDFAYQSLGITFCDHGPTHVDALSHLDPRPDAPTIDRMDLAQFCGEGTCLDVSGVEPREYITAAHLERAAAGVDLRGIGLPQVDDGPNGAVEQRIGPLRRQPFVLLGCEALAARKKRSFVVGEVGQVRALDRVSSPDCGTRRPPHRHAAIPN